VAESDAQRVLELYGSCLAKQLTEQAGALTGEVIEALASKSPELLGPDPRLGPLAVEAVRTSLESVAAGIADRRSLEDPPVLPAMIEFGRLLAQLGVPVNSLLLGHQLQRGISVRRLMERVATIADSREDLALLADAALAYELAYWDAAAQAAVAAHNSVRNRMSTGSRVGLSRHADAILEGAITSAAVAESLLGYRLTNHHVAGIVWFDGSQGRPVDMLAADRALRALPAVRDALVIPKNGRTLHCWLNVSDEAAVDQWPEVMREPERAWRIGLGEPGVGIEGFRLSHMQALTAGAVLAAARPEAGSVVRYRDVATISFMVDHPAEASVWVAEILGDLAGPGAERERLRHTLHIFFEEGEDAVATGHRLFIHRNTVKYRLDHARRILPHGFAHRRLEVALALKYCEWIGVLTSRG